MHRSLRTLEIIFAICSNLDIRPTPYPWQSRANRAALSALARSCRMFSDPALDVLWNYQDALDPFLRLFPQDLFRSRDEPEITWSILRPLMSSDWNRISIYSSRVKVLSLTWPPPGMLDILQALSLSCPGGFVFPKLRTLRWTGVVQAFLPIRALLSPTIRSISIRCATSSINLSLLSNLGASCPRLSHVAITFDCASDHVVAATSLFICTLQQLRSLTIHTPSLAAMQHLAALPGLTSLVIGHIPAAFLTPGNNDPHNFSDLRELTVGPIGVGQATILLNAFSRHPFHSLNFNLASDASAHAAEALFQALVPACLPEFLESFTLRTSPGAALPTPREQYLLTGRALGWLACFVRMRTVKIMIPVGFDLDDATVIRLATAWPLVETVSLKSDALDPRLQNSIVSVLAFAQCPKLRGLSIEFDAVS
ncbi:hypothetical protein C8R47DRAFT_1061856, partial [Mycena vitilis]